ncbi:MAG: trigger factor, partial [Alphaproteobacteria bacterium]
EFTAIWQQVEADKAAGKLEGDDADKPEDELKAEYRKIAERRVKLGLLLSEVGNKNEIEINEQDLTQAIIKEARKYPGQEQQVFEFFTKNRDAQMSLRAPILEDKVVDFIVALAKTSKKEISVEDLGKLVEEMEKEDA